MSEMIEKANKLQVDLFENVRLANKGDKSALANLRSELAGARGAEVVDFCGDLAFQAEESLLASTLGDQEGAKACVREKMKQMRLQLGWEESPTLERMLIDRIVTSWLNLHCLELVAHQWKGGSIAVGKYHQHRIDRAHNRYLSSFKMLATVRKMALPIKIDLKAQINIASEAENSDRYSVNRFGAMVSSN